MRTLKNLVRELEELVHQHRGQRIEDLKRELDLAEAVNEQRVAAGAVEILAHLLSVVTNVATLLR
jgi:hypothetical protein